jgi:hypothetical protein
MEAKRLQFKIVDMLMKKDAKYGDAMLARFKVHRKSNERASVK